MGTGNGERGGPWMVTIQEPAVGGPWMVPIQEPAIGRHTNATYADTGPAL